MREFIFITKALSDKNRIRIILALNEKELCVCQITRLLNLAPSTVSKHLSILNHAQLIESRKEGRWVHYRLAKDKTSSKAVNWVIDSLINDTKIIEDRKQLMKILQIGAEELCKTVMKNPMEVREISKKRGDSL